MGSVGVNAALVLLVLAVALVLVGAWLVAGLGAVLIVLGVLLGGAALLVDFGGGDRS